MAISIRSVEPFQLRVEDLDQYTERLAQYFTTNGIRDDKKAVVLLTMVGVKIYVPMSNLAAPAKLAEKTYNELVTMTKVHLKPKPLTIAERFNFHLRNLGEARAFRRIWRS